MTDNTSTQQGIIDIDAGLCSGLGECVRVAPDVIELDGDGIARVTRATGDLRLLQDIADSCPMAAIMVRRLESADVA